MSTYCDIGTALPRPAVGRSLLLTRNKVVINYFISGSGETVLLLPAFARAASDYNELVASLNAAGYRTVAIELRGMGQSKSPVFPKPSMHDFAKDVANIAGALDDLPGGKVHVLGRAFGARVGRAFAADYPHLAQSLIMMAGSGTIRLSGTRLLKYIVCNSRFIPEWLRIRAVGATLYAPGNKVPRCLAYRHPFRAVDRQFFALLTPLDEIWRGEAVPILWIRGERDRFAPVTNAYALRDQFPDQVKLVVIPGAAHALLPEQPEICLRLITTFLREHALQTNSD